AGVLGLEVHVERRARDLGLLDHVDDGELVEAAVLQEPLGRVEQRLAHVGGVLAAPARDDGRLDATPTGGAGAKPGHRPESTGDSSIRQVSRHVYNGGWVSLLEV